jgi:flagellar protein FliS
MAANGHGAYVAEKILSADPVELIRMLYRAAMESVEAARRHLAAGAIPARSSAISKAIEILCELSTSLSKEAEISRPLAELYDYMQRRLLAANFEQKDAPLAEVGRLLATLAEAWEAVPALATPSEAKVRPAMPATWNPLEPAPEGALHGWSF